MIRGMQEMRARVHVLLRECLLILLNPIFCSTNHQIMKKFTLLLLVVSSAFGGFEVQAQRSCLVGCETDGRSNLRFDARAAQQLFDSLYYRLDSLTAYVAACNCGAAEEPPAAPQSSGHPCAEATLMYNGYAYGIFDIGGKNWFVENLQTTQFRNGDVIPSSPNTWDGYVEWSNLTTPARYDLDGEASVADLGRLYNAMAIEDERGLCPTGWHVSSDADWIALADAYGGKTSAGLAMKNTPEDSPQWDGTNETCFSAVKSGYRWDQTDADWLDPEVDTGWGVANAALWWSSTPGNEGHHHMWLVVSDNNDLIEAGDRTDTHGYSVRCVED